MAGCTSSQQVAAWSERLNDRARAIVGTSLIGTRGATTEDQDKIDDTGADVDAGRVLAPRTGDTVRAGAGALPTNSSIDRQLGIVIGKLDGIEDRLNRQDESRAVLHRRMDDLVMREAHMEANVSSLKNKVEGMKKVTVEVTTLRTKAEGAGTAGRWLIRAGIAILSFAGWVVGPIRG